MDALWSAISNNWVPLTLVPVTRKALLQISSNDIRKEEVPHALCLYKDGSTAAEPIDASWVVVVFSVFTVTDGDWTGFTRAESRLPPLHHQYLGATFLTNGSAELSAQAWAMMIAFECVAKHKVGRIEMRYDSEIAAGATMATIKAKVHPTRIAIASTDCIALGMRTNLSFLHIYSRDKEPWNELADSLAKAILQCGALQTDDTPPCNQ
jgi:hypothetical protein